MGRLGAPGQARLRESQLEPEDVAAPEAFAVAAAPDGYPRPAVDLPRAIAADDRGVLVDAEDGDVARRLEGHERDHDLWRGVVVRQDGDGVHQRQAILPAKRPGEHAATELGLACGEDHGPGGAACDHGPTLVGRPQGATGPGAVERPPEVARLAAREVDEIGLADGLGGGLVAGLLPIPDEDRLDPRARRRA